MPGVIPSLSLNMPLITDPKEQVVYLLKHAFHNPGWTSSFIEDSLVSMRKLRAQYTEDKTKFTSALQIYLQNAIQRYQPSFRVEVSSRDVDVNTYTLVIAITDSMNRLVLSTSDIKVIDGVIVLKTDTDNKEN